MSFLLGIDLGTSSVKCILASEGGHISGVAEREYPIRTPRPDWSEQSPETWWQMTTEAVQELLANSGISKQEIKVIGLSGQMHGTVFLGQDDAVLRPAIIWADQRSAIQCEQIYQQIGYERLAKIAGSGVFPGFMLASLLWVQENEPRIWERLQFVLFPKDYIRLRLTGEIATDISDASSGLLVDIQSRTWSEELVGGLSIPTEILPKILESHQIAGQLTTDGADTLGLKAGIPVVAGAADQATGALGSGIVTPNILAATIGSGGQLVTLLTAPHIDEQLRVHTFCHAVPKIWYLLGATLSAGLSFRWLRDSILHEPPSGAYERMVNLAQTVAPGAEGLLFLPYLVGERVAKQVVQPKGLFYGLTLSHDQPHLVRATMEGIIFSLRRVFDVFVELGANPQQIIATGGGARSELWCQMIADVFQAPVVKLGVQEQSAVGAVILAGVGARIYRDAAEAAQIFVTYAPPVEPEVESTAVYKDLYELFCTLYLKVSRLG